MDDKRRETATSTIPRVPMPPIDPPSPEEIVRRRELFARVIALREEIGLIDIAADELVHMSRVEADGPDDT